MLLHAVTTPGVSRYMMLHAVTTPGVSRHRPTLRAPPCVVSGCQDGSLGYWSAKRKKPIAMVPHAHGEAPWGGACWLSAMASPCFSDLAISGSCDGSIRFWHCDEEARSVSQVPLHAVTRRYWHFSQVPLHAVTRRHMPPHAATFRHMPPHAACYLPLYRLQRAATTPRFPRCRSCAASPLQTPLPTSVTGCNRM